MCYMKLNLTYNKGCTIKYSFASFALHGHTLSVKKKYNYGICAGQRNSSLIKFIVNSINIYVSK